MLSQWKQEAHHLLSLPFSESPCPEDQEHIHSEYPFHTSIGYDFYRLFNLIVLKNKCTSFNTPRSYRYFTIKILHLICCTPLFWLYEDLYSLLLHTCLFSALISIAFIDAEHQLIPDECCGVILSCALIIHFINQTLEGSILGLLIGLYLTYVLGLLYRTIRQQEGIGLGDVKLISALGAWLGVSNLAPLLLCASLSGILYTIVTHNKDTKQVPFGPFLIFSAILVFFYNL